MDLVAHLVRKVCDNLYDSREDSMLDANHFRFVFYVSFPKREDSIGLDMLENLEKMCKSMKNPLFILHLRLSNESR